MKSKTIQETLAKVLEIDEASVRMEQEIEALKGTKEKELRKLEREMELSYMKEARKKGKEAYDKVLEVAKAEESDILEEGESTDRRMRKLFEKNETRLVQEAMKKIFGDAYVGQKG